MKIKSLLLAAFLAAPAAAQTSAIVSTETAKPQKHWYEKLSLKGYAQIRYNQIAESDPNLQCQQCDRSLGSGDSIFLRRARLIISGDVTDNVYIYIQPDFASNAGTSQQFLQIRDAYGDIALDPLKENRLRVGQSKVPYGFENPQSSSNRLAFDRDDAINSGAANERDMGVFYYWAPAEIRKRFAELANAQMKGTGDYGVFGLGAYNGQTANRADSNRSLHTAARLTYPFKLANGQFIEAGVSGFLGRYVVAADQRTAGIAFERGTAEFHDRRAAAHFVVYPQPWGLQAEATWGEGPEFDGPTRVIQKKVARGGYLQTMYKLNLKNGDIVIPYLRAQYYKGGKKHETDARRYLVREIEGGAEWQINKALELTGAYAYADRAYEDFNTRGTRHIGGRVRLQLQLNY